MRASDLYCRILDLRLQGHGPSEIASTLSLSHPTIDRALSLLRQRLEGDERRSR
jgi:DNA-binding CsgD family transcriptional regulator